MNRGMWSHILSMDVNMLILKIQFRGPDYIKAKVEWFYKSGKPLNIKHNAKILRKHFADWSPI